jgi:hypothetical protein
MYDKGKNTILGLRPSFVPKKKEGKNTILFDVLKRHLRMI